MEFENLKQEIEDTIENIKEVQDRLSLDGTNYERLKHEYRIKLLKLKYSKEYEKCSSLKMKDEKAELELADMKQELVDRKSGVDMFKYKLDYYNLKLRYLFRLFDEEIGEDD